MACSDTHPTLQITSAWHVLLFVVVIRLLLNVPALIGANCLPPPDQARLAWETKPAWVEVWAEWDSGYYLKIAENGYAVNGDELAFFPFYPLLIRWVALGNTKLMPFIGYLIANISFIVATLVLWWQVAGDHGKRVASATIVLVSLFPTSFFFSAVYTESLFFLFAVIVYAFSTRRRYAAAAICVSLASVTRVTGLFLATIPIVELLSHETTERWRALITCGAICGIGAGSYGLYLAINHGSPFAFASTVTHWERSRSWPWASFLDSLRVAFFGYGGFVDNWFMRLTSLSEVLVVGVFCACLAGIWIYCRRSLFVATSLQILLHLASHGPYTLGLWSWTRYALTLFPCFVVMGIVYTRRGSPKWVLVISALLLTCLTMWFGSGRWVA